MEDRIMSNFIMQVIPEPKPGTASVLIFAKKGKFTFIKSQGSDNYLCGACENVICENVDRGNIINLVFRCPNCDSYNILKGT
jgi:hypothetical protein